MRNRDLRPAARQTLPSNRPLKGSKSTTGSRTSPKAHSTSTPQRQKLLSVFGEYRAAHHYHHRGNGGGLYFLYEGPAAP